ncbi:hypothetical protein RV09_GL002478 [Enterococcus moraviensis]|nr:hypothetical protein RV09_GL002478 [Enterococcus moraviensis]
MAKNDSLIEDDAYNLFADMSDSFESVAPSIEDDMYNHEGLVFPASQTKSSFSDALQQIIRYENYFGNLAVWEKLVASINEWSIDEYMQNTYTIQLFLVENYSCLAREIIRFLFKTFDLTNLTDHIGQELFVSSTFLYLKKTIYTVPPFSFQLAETIPANLRKQYFTLRFDIYQLIAQKQGFAVNIEDLIAKCADLFAEDSELWNLKMIDWLDKTNGLVDTYESKELVEDFITRTQTMNDNPTTTFLIAYFQLVKGDAKDDSIFNWNKEQLTLPDELFILILGSIFFHKKDFVPAFNLWKQLSLSRKIALKKQLEDISRHLPRQEKKEYRQIKKEIRNVQKKKHPVLLALMQFFTFPVIIVAFAFLSNGTSDNHLPDETLSASQEHYMEEFSETKQLYDGPLEEQFVYYFYASNDPEGKQLFIDSTVYNDQLKERLEHYVYQDTNKYSDMSAFKFKSDALSDSENQKIAVYYKDEFLCILVFGKYKVLLDDIYGDQWQPLSDAQLESMSRSIRINPESTTTIFLRKFLFSDNKQQNLLEYTDYLSENMKIVIENNLNAPIPVNMEKGYLYLVREPQVKMIVSDLNKNEEKLILTFDESGRLAHVFGPNWEEVDEEMIHYSNREAFKNISTLLEEPD